MLYIIELHFWKFVIGIYYIYYIMILCINNTIE